MDIEKLRSFITAASLGNLSAAADELFLTASAVSKHISSLESQLGVALFSRKAKHLILTEAGAICLESATAIVEEYDRLFLRLAHSSALTILSIPFQSFIMPMLSGFEKQHPDISLRIKDMHGPEAAAAVERGDYELAFTGSVYSRLPGLEQYVFHREKVKVLLPEGHPLSGRASISIKELRNESFSLMAPETGLYQDYIELCLRNGFNPNVIYTSTREDTLVAHVASGSSVTFFTECEIIRHNLEGTAFIPLAEDYETGFALLRRRGDKLSPSAEAFWKYVTHSIL